MGRYVLITGTSKGLGRFLVTDFIKAGYIVFAGYRKEKEYLVELESKYKELLPIQMDVSDEASVIKAKEKVKGITNSLDILINNAAVYLEGKKPDLPSIEEIDIQKVIDTYNVNSAGCLRVLKHFYKMIENGKQRLIINISSEAGSLQDCWRDREFGYCMSKAAMNMATRILHNYSKNKGIKVISLHPGWMKTDMGGMDADIYPEEASRKIVEFALKLDEKDVLYHQYYDYNGNPMKW
ncbi:MAG: SDR family oxidoreductase [Brevinematia bacterium]